MIVKYCADCRCRIHSSFTRCKACNTRRRYANAVHEPPTDLAMTYKPLPELMVLASAQFKMGVGDLIERTSKSGMSLRSAMLSALTPTE